MTVRHPIEAEGLFRRFGDFTAVRNLSFAVAAGEVFGLLGANGAGKTTTFRMLCGLLPASAGGAIANLAGLLAGKALVNLNYSASREALAAASSAAFFAMASRILRMRAWAFLASAGQRVGTSFATTP